MIDVEPLVYQKIYDAVTEYDSDICIEGTYNDVPAQFPFVSVEQETNSLNQDTQSTTRLENHARVSFVSYIHTVGADRISKAREIRDVIDVTMTMLGFVRMTAQAVPNADRNVYRYLLRYSGVVSKTESGNNTIFKVYAR